MALEERRTAVDSRVRRRSPRCTAFAKGRASSGRRAARAQPMREGGPRRLDAIRGPAGQRGPCDGVNAGFDGGGTAAVADGGRRHGGRWSRQARARAGLAAARGSGRDGGGERATQRRARGKVGAMEWFFIEALFALRWRVAIVWWTMGPQKKLPRDAKTGAARRAQGRSLMQRARHRQRERRNRRRRRPCRPRPASGRCRCIVPTFVGDRRAAGVFEGSRRAGAAAAGRRRPGP